MEEQRTNQTLPRIVHIKDDVAGAIYIGRTMGERYVGGPLANPFKIGRDGTRYDVITKFKQRIVQKIKDGDAATIDALIAARSAPALECWCRHDGDVVSESNLCHGDLIVLLLENNTDDVLQARLRKRQNDAFLASR